jgi:hypothetical protein
MALAGVIVLALGFPMAAMVLLSATGAFSPDLLSMLLVGGTIFAFATLAIFEIMRLVEDDGQAAPHGLRYAGAPNAELHPHGALESAPVQAPEPVRGAALPEPAPSVPTPAASNPADVRDAAPISVAARPAPAAADQPMRLESPAPVAVPVESAIRIADAARSAVEPSSGAETPPRKAEKKTGTRPSAKNQAKSGPKASVTKEPAAAKKTASRKTASAAREQSGAAAKPSRPRGPAKI